MTNHCLLLFQAPRVADGVETGRTPTSTAMEHYREAMRDIEKERANFLAKIDLVKPSFEEQHQLEVSATTRQTVLLAFKSFT